jgi:aryl-alcohol dehydrogenase
MLITAAVTETPGGQFLLRELELEDPRPDEIRVRMVAAGICHSDLSARDQNSPLPLPIVLGHEGAGIVDTVGTAVTTVVPGDHVVLNAHSCGTCPECVAGRPFRCGSAGVLNLSGARRDGSTGLSDHGKPVHGQFFGQSSFATYALAHQRNVTRLDPGFDLTLAPAIACGVTTGAGTVLTGLRPEAGSSIAVFGTGTVGLAAVMAARLAGCGTIIAVDLHDTRLDLARRLGATHTIRPDGDLAVQVRAAEPEGVHHSVETTGVAAVAQTAVYSLRRGGISAQLGVAPAGTELGLDITRLALTGVGVRGFPSGTAVPDVLLPRLIELYRQGRFPIDQLVTTYPFADIERAAADTTSGATVKPILLFDPAAEAIRPERNGP